MVGEWEVDMEDVDEELLVVDETVDDVGDVEDEVSDARMRWNDEVVEEDVVEDEYTHSSSTTRPMAERTASRAIAWVTVRVCGSVERSTVFGPGSGPE